MKSELLSFFKRKSLQINTSLLLRLFFFLAFLGILDAGYITYTHYAHIIPPCITGGCETVLKSQYTSLLGIPNAVLGILYYGLVMVLIALYWKTFSIIPVKAGIQEIRNSKSYSSNEVRSLQTSSRFARTIPSLLLILTLLGLITGIYLIYLQGVLIHAYCQYCLFSELIDFLLFDCAWWLWRRSGR